MDGMIYFYDYFVKDYQKSQEDRLLPAPAALFGTVERESVHICRRVLRNAFCGYRDGRNTELLKRLLGEYRGYISNCQGERARDRYNAFVYRYMVETHVGVKAIGSKLGVTKDTVFTYISRALNELLMLCMGIPAAAECPKGKEGTVHMLVEDSRLFQNMAGDYVLSLFPGWHERETLEQGRELTAAVMGQLADAVKAYCDYCNNSDTRIDTDIRRAEILEKCLAGVPCCRIAEEHGCCESTIYTDIRENEKRLAAMMFGLK